MTAIATRTDPRRGWGEYVAPAPAMPRLSASAGLPEAALIDAPVCMRGARRRGHSVAGF